jgi:hypothetical protein
VEGRASAELARTDRTRSGGGVGAARHARWRPSSIAGRVAARPSCVWGGRSLRERDIRGWRREASGREMTEKKARGRRQRGSARDLASHG